MPDLPSSMRLASEQNDLETYATNHCYRTLTPRGHAFAGALLTVCASACVHTGVLERTSEVVRPEASFDYAEGFHESGGAQDVCGDLGDRRLAELQERLVLENLDLRGAVARLEAAEARAREAGAILKPRLDLQLQATESNTSSFSFGSTGGSGAPTTASGASGSTTTYQPSVAASYEIDVWGKHRNRRQAAALDAEASADDLVALSITLSSQLTEVWFGIAAERELISLLTDQISTSERFLELTKLRFGQGLGAAQDIGRQKEQVLGLEGQIDLTQGRLEFLETQLSALLGSTERLTPPSSFDLGRLLEGSSLPELGVPAQLLQTRPDLLAAERRLRAADRQLAAAVKEWFPSFSLTGTLFDLRTTISDLFEDVLWQLIGRASQSVYEGGARGARVDQARAAAEERLYAYGQALVIAVGEVHGAISSERSQTEFAQNLGDRLREARRVLELTREAYRQGATDYLNVLTALLSEQSLEQQLIGAQRQQLVNRVQLCRALGHPTAISLDRLVETGLSVPRTNNQAFFDATR